MEGAEDYMRLTMREKQALTGGGTPVKLKAGTTKRRKGGGRKPLYGQEVTASLRRIWVFFGYRCGKLLCPLIREQMSFFAA
jgi:hypothetical protein